MAKRTPEQILAAIDAWDDDDSAEGAIAHDEVDAEAERVLAMTEEERERALRAAGVDVGREKENAVAWRTKAERGELPEIAGVGAPRASAVATPPVAAAGPVSGAPVVPLRLPGRRGGHRVLMLLAASFVLGVGLLIVAQRLGDESVASAPPSDGAAAKVRQKAFAACEAQRWGECLRGLDEARDLDPAGEGDARVRGYRRRAEEGAKGQ
jgi:hypothetical protein